MQHFFINNAPWCKISFKMMKKVQVILFNKITRKILLLKTNPLRGAFWQNITGSVNFKESFKDAAIRELKEETNLISEVTDTKSFFIYFKNYKIIFEKVFLAITIEEKITLSTEHMDYKWKEIDAIKADDFKYKSNYKGFLKCLPFLSL